MHNVLKIQPIHDIMFVYNVHGEQCTHVGVSVEIELKIDWQGFNFRVNKLNIFKS